MEKRSIEALGRTWSWPVADEKCHKVAFDWAKDLRAVYPHCRAFECVVQAGGNMGVWPWLLAKKFKYVLTFEADPVCFPFLLENIAGTSNVEACHAALMDVASQFHMETIQPNNLGAQYVQPGGSVQSLTIDSLFLSSCDLIYLDIEGAEMKALQGAAETISIFKPVIAVEDNGLSSRFGSAKGDIEKWLAKEFGYSVVARPHRDVVLACK